MAGIATVSTWRPRDGKLQDFVARVATAKKIHERLGAKVRVWQTAFGGQPLTVGYVIEHAGWEAFGKFGQKLEADSEWQQFWTDALSHPAADLLQNSVVTEIPGLV
jgi:hypothetical protein